MLRTAPIALVALVASCSWSRSPVPPEVAERAGRSMCELGHPGGEYRRTEVAGWRKGRGDHDRYVDLDVFYDRRGMAEVMRVRVYVHETEPCRITTDVLEDSGPPAILLDNAISSEAMGEAICEAMAGAGS